MKFIKSIDNKYKTDFLIIFVLYSISFFLLLINLGVFWDDWVLYNMAPNIVLDTFNQAGSVGGGYFHNFFLSIGNSVTPYRILVFITYFFSSIFLYYILSSISEISQFDRLLIVILFAILPVNSARIALIDAHAALNHFLFWLGFLFLSLYLKERKMVFRIIALIFLFFSFRAQSLLVFYSIVILYIAYIDLYKRISTFSISSTINKIFSYTDFIILPIVFWIIKITWFKPYSLYEGYNKLSLERLYNVPKLLLLSFDTSFIEPLKQSFAKNSIISMAILGIIIFLLLRNKYSQKADSKSFMFFYFGWFLFFLAVFPYNVVGQVPRLTDWLSRYQILIPLGVSLILIYGIRLLIPSERIQKLIYSLIISSFLLTNISFYVDFQKDWYKQASLIENFKTSEIIKGNSSFLFDDKIEKLNATQRAYRFYEYTGLMKYAFGNETRFGDRKQSFSDIDYFTKYLNAYYNMKDCRIIKPQYIVEINGKEISKKDLIKLKYLELFKTDKYKENIRELTVLKYQKIL
jgi:hypothetical protein